MVLVLLEGMKTTKMKNKRGISGWIWILIILIAIGIGLYLWLSGDGGAAVNLGSGEIPQPPALPSG